MTLRKAKSIARHLRLTLRQVCSGDYRVNFRDGNETTAYYTDSLEDAINTAVGMAVPADNHDAENSDYPRLAIAQQSQQLPQPGGPYCVPGSDKAPKAVR